MANDINKERRVIPSKAFPTTPASSEAQRYYDSLPKSKAIRQPPGVAPSPYGGSKDPRKND